MHAFHLTFQAHFVIWTTAKAIRTFGVAAAAFCWLIILDRVVLGLHCQQVHASRIEKLFSFFYANHKWAFVNQGMDGKLGLVLTLFSVRIHAHTGINLTIYSRIFNEEIFTQMNFRTSKINLKNRKQFSLGHLWSFDHIGARNVFMNVDTETH